MHALQDFEKTLLKNNLPHFKAGDTVKVHCKIKEGDKERIQIFEGVVVGRHNSGLSSSFTVRKVSYGVGVERIFPLHAPFIDRIEVMSTGKVRRSKIYYLRERAGKKARISTLDTRGQTAAAGALAEESAKAPPPTQSENPPTEEGLTTSASQPEGEKSSPKKKAEKKK